ncbi:MAG: hypothetical protein Kow0077_14080 [Anaerolineae bacterium]
MQNELRDWVLAHLELPEEAPSLPYLNRILLAWSQRIPWESASRIARHLLPGTPEAYARPPEVFLADTLRLGTGGTCYESNLALRAVLQALGFEATLAFCDMRVAIGDPHCALVVTLDGLRYMADVGYPIPAALLLDEEAPTEVETPVYQYCARPVAHNRWLVQRRSHRFEQVVFWVKGAPVDEARFMARLVEDHAEEGQFLSEVIIQKVRQREIWRFSESKGLVRRRWGREDQILLYNDPDDEAAAILSRLFRMDRRVIEAALYRRPPDPALWPDLRTG